MAEVTGTKIGETETLFITGLGGIFYGLFAVQPLTVLAFTGPILVFDATIFDVCIFVCAVCGYATVLHTVSQR